MALLYAALAYMLGIVAGRLLWDAAGATCPLPEWLWLLPAALLPATPWLNRLRQAPLPVVAMRWPAAAGFEVPASQPRTGLVAALALCLLAGGLRYASRPYTPCWTPEDLAYYNLPADRAFDRAAPIVTLTGYVSSYPLRADLKQDMAVTVSRLKDENGARAVQGVVRLKTGIAQRYTYGQPVRVRGRLVTPPAFEGFSYAEYLARKGVGSLVYSPRIEAIEGSMQGSALLRLLYGLRARGEALLNRSLSEPYAGLANGMLLGIEAGIPDDLYDQFNATGSSHVIVISGSNVALISGVVVAAAARVMGRRRAVWPALAGIGCYALLVGGDAAVLRASVMGSLFVVATALDRRSTALVSLSVACAAMTVANPLALWDVGLQLSSAATAGLILLSPGMGRGFRKLVKRGGQLMAAPALKAATGFLEDGLLVTLAANITTLPLVVYYFGRLSVVSLLTNLLIVPVQPIIMLGGSAGVVAGVAGFEWPARLILWLPWLGLAWTVAIVQWTARLPGASIEVGGYGTAAMLVTYGAIAAVRWRAPLAAAVRRAFGWLQVDWLARLATPGAAGALGVAVFLTWSGALSQPDGRLHVWFLDIGQGDGMLIQTPSGRQVLVDGGASPQALFSELGAVMPFWDRNLDLAILTHPDADHIDAQTEVPARLAVDTAWDTAAGQANANASRWRERMAAGGTQVQVVHAGGWADLGDGVALWVIWPPPGGYVGENADNENSIVTKLVYGNLSILLTGDAGIPAEQAMVASGAPLASTVLKAGHHGSKASTGEAFVKAVNPAMAVIQVGAENDYGHPSPEALERLAGRMVLRSDQDGRVHLWSDGQWLWVETEK